MSTATPSRAAQAAENIDSRYHLSAGIRRQINKVFPTHWSFLLGEIALYAFIILLISGVYLTLFFDPSMAHVVYDGVYQPLRGVGMSRAYETTLNLSFEVRGGLFVRQIHHWAALMFAASIVVHLLRIFFTGAFRRPREANWVIGSLLLILAMFEGFFGYSLPDDLLSGTGLRAAFSGITLSIPVIGTWMHWALFGGDFPGDLIIPRFYVLHVLLVPGIILALIAAHLALVWYQKHTQFPGPGRTEHNVVGKSFWPSQVFKSTGLMLMVAAVLALARRFAGTQNYRTLRFVAFVNEEPLYFQSTEMGSYVYAQRCRERGDQISAMISLETIGYFSGLPHSQRYPAPGFGLLYPRTGNFIGFVSNIGSRSLLRAALGEFRRHAQVPSEGAALPAGVPGVGWSDQWAFWQHGYPGIMVTDTAPFRYPHYHRPSDTPDKLDYDSMTRVVTALEKMIRQQVNPRR